MNILRYIVFYFRVYSCIVDCVQKKNLIDFEPYIKVMEKFVELDLARFVKTKREHLEMIFDVYKKGNFNILKLLVQASQDKNPQDPKHSREETLLHRAARNGKVEFVQFLVPLLKDRSPKDNNDQTPLYYALSNGHFEIMMLICGPLEYQKLKSSDVALTNIAVYQFLYRCFEGLKADAKDGSNTKEDIGLCIVDMEQILGNL